MAGELITADYQLELNGLLMGAGQRAEFGEAGIEGLGVPPAKTGDVDLQGADGAYAPADFVAVRTLLVHLVMTADDDGHIAWDQFLVIAPAWTPQAADAELHLQLPGWGHVFWTGRPRGLELDATLGPKGRLDAIGTFVALNPTTQAFIP